MQLTAIKVKILRKKEGNRMVNDYPSFNDLAANVRGDMDWSCYIDAFGIGWHYDKISGFGETDAENTDPASQYAITAVPDAFDELPDQVILDVQREGLGR